MTDELAIDVRGMTKRFGERTVVNDIALQVRAGEIYGFLGPNGSGTCLGHDVIHETEEIKRNVGYMTQRFSFWEDLSIAENLDFVARMYGVKNRGQAVQKSLDELGLASRQKQLAGELSGGWKQRLALAACLLHQPRLLLLDEPTAGVDPKARRDFWEHIHQLAAQGLTFLVTTHYMDEAERCHRLAYISYGTLLTHGTVDEVIDHVKLTTWSVTGPDLLNLAGKLREQPGVQQAVAFGNMIHVSGDDAVALEKAIAPFRKEPYRWQKIRAGLEDVFIHLMDDAKDNFAS